VVVTINMSLLRSWPNPAHALDGWIPSLLIAGHDRPATSDEHRWAGGATGCYLAQATKGRMAPYIRPSSARIIELLRRFVRQNELMLAPFPRKGSNRRLVDAVTTTRTPMYGLPHFPARWQPRGGFSGAPLSNEQGTWNSSVQRHETDGVLASQFNQVTIGHSLRRLHERRQMRRAEVVRNQFKTNP